MQRTKSIVGAIGVKVSAMMHEVPAKRIACLTAVAGGLALANLGLGDEKEGPARSPTVPPAAAQRSTSPDRGSAARTDRADNEGHVRHHGALGVLLSTSEDGVVVVGVIPGSPAERAGLRSGDEILYVVDQRIHTVQELTDTVGGYKPGTQVDLLIRRNGRRQIVEVNVASRESTIGNPDRSGSAVAGQNAGATTGGGAQANVGRRPGPNPPAATSAQIRERQLNQRLRDLERQIYHMQNQLSDVRYSQSTHAANMRDMQDWWERQHHGQADDDPALFQ